MIALKWISRALMIALSNNLLWSTEKKAKQSVSICCMLYLPTKNKLFFNCIPLMWLWSRSNLRKLFKAIRELSFHWENTLHGSISKLKVHEGEQLACLVTHSHPFVPLLRSIHRQRGEEEKKREKVFWQLTFTLEPFARVYLSNILWRRNAPFCVHSRYLDTH